MLTLEAKPIYSSICVFLYFDKLYQLSYFSDRYFRMQVEGRINSFKLSVKQQARNGLQPPQNEKYDPQQPKQTRKLYPSHEAEESMRNLKLKMNQIQTAVRKKSYTHKRTAQELKLIYADNFHLRKTAPYELYCDQSSNLTKTDKASSNCSDLVERAKEIIKKSNNLAERLQFNKNQHKKINNDKYNSIFNTSLSLTGNSYLYSPSFNNFNHHSSSLLLQPLQIMTPREEKIDKNEAIQGKAYIENAQCQQRFLMFLQQNKDSPHQIESKNRHDLNDEFELVKQLGKGRFGDVYLGKHVKSGFLAAIKKVSKQNLLSCNMVQRFTQEIHLHSQLDHPNIVKFYGFYEEKDHICLVLEYLSGGTLFDFQNNKEIFTVKEAAGFLKEIISAFIYLHEKRIAHRDLKPQNIVLSATGMAKLCDFGFSTVVQSPRSTFCGTLDYASPEILEKKQYDWSVDVWGLGILTYELLIGHAPFQNQDRQKVMQGITNVDKTKLPGLQSLPWQAQEFIQALLQKDPQSRPKITELLNFSLFVEANKKTKPLP